MMTVLLGDLKIAQKSQNPQNPQDTCSKNPGACFLEVAEVPQAARTQTHGAGRPWDEIWTTFMTFGQTNDYVLTNNYKT